MRQPSRTASILATISFGVCSLIVFESFNEGNIRDYRESIMRSQYGHGQIMTHGYFESFPEKPSDHWIENPERVVQQLEQNDMVYGVYPRIGFQALLSNGDRTRSGIGQGILAEKEADFFNKMNVVDGELLKAQDEGIMVGEGLAKALGLRIGDNVTILLNTVSGTMNGSDLTLVGVFKTGRKDFDDHYFRIQLTKAQELLDTKKAEIMAVALKDWRAWNEFGGFLKTRFAGLEALSISVIDKVHFQNAMDWLESQFVIILSIIMTIVILGILNIINANVFERRAEIGNLLVNGFQYRDILKLLILEGAAMGLLGGLIGVGVSFFIQTVIFPNGIRMPPTPGLTLQFDVPLVITSHMILKHTIIGCSTAIIATIFAAARVFRVPLVQLLRIV